LYSLILIIDDTFLATPVAAAAAVAVVAVVAILLLLFFVYKIQFEHDPF
jgi:hypothetical protein